MSVFATVGCALKSQQVTEELSLCEVNKRRKGSSTCSIAKLLSVASLISCVALALFAVMAVESMLLMSLVLSLSGLGVLVSYDIFVIAGRAQKVLDNVDNVVKNTPYDQALYLTQGTIIASSIAQLALRKN